MKSRRANSGKGAGAAEVGGALMMIAGWRDYGNDETMPRA